MHKVIERTRIVPNIHLLRVEAPDVVRKVQPGNFVILKIDEVAERVPLTVADWDEQTGILTCVLMTVGEDVDWHHLRHWAMKLGVADLLKRATAEVGTSQ